MGGDDFQKLFSAFEEKSIGMDPGFLPATLPPAALQPPVGNFKLTCTDPHVAHQQNLQMTSRCIQNDVPLEIQLIPFPSAKTERERGGEEASGLRGI